MFILYVSLCSHSVVVMCIADCGRFFWYCEKSESLIILWKGKSGHLYYVMLYHFIMEPTIITVIILQIIFSIDNQIAIKQDKHHRGTNINISKRIIITVRCLHLTESLRHTYQGTGDYPKIDFKKTYFLTKTCSTTKMTA